MDKTAWIVVTTCLALLGLNFYVQSTKEAEVVPAAPAAQVAPAATPETAASPAPVAPAVTEATPAATVAAPVAAAPIAATPKIVATLISRNARGEAVARYTFQNIGGSIKYVEMLGKAVNSTKEDLQEDVRINGGSLQGIGTLMFGLSETSAPNFDQSVYELLSATDTSVTLQANVGNLVVRKTFTTKQFPEGEPIVEGREYLLDMDVVVVNNTTQDLQASNWGIFTGVTAPISAAEGPQYTYYVSFEDGKFEKENAGSFRPWFGEDKSRIYRKDHNNLEWAGAMNQYYASLLLPNKQSQSNSFYAAPTKVLVPAATEPKDAVELGLGMPDFTLSAKSEGVGAVPQSFSYTLFTGPKLNMMLEGLNSEFNMIDSIMDYGWLTIISYPMNWLINVFHGWFGNWGWAIMAMTLVVRLCIWPLYRKSYMSMKRMSLLQPQMKELKEKYPDDAQKVNMEMMKLYKKYGISPLGGCLPMFLQIPIFFAFFYVLQTAAEFRGASFLGWVTDLSQMDTVAMLDLFGYNLPINILPIVMAISMLVQMRMTPQAGDPTQQKIMRWMPLMFFAFCYTYPSALALYWTTQNIISIGQTWLIQRMSPPVLTEAPVKKAGKKGFFERMMEQQQAALAEQQRRAKQQGGERNVTPKKK